MFQPFHADTDASVHDEYLIGISSLVWSLPACSPRSHMGLHEVSEASRSAEEVLFQDDVTFT